MAARPLRLGEVRPRAERGPAQRAPVANHGCRAGSACLSARLAAEWLSGTPSGGFAGPWRPPDGRHIRLCLWLAGAQDVGRQRARAAPRSSARPGWPADPGFRASSHAVEGPFLRGLSGSGPSTGRPPLLFRAQQLRRAQLMSQRPALLFTLLGVAPRCWKCGC